MENIGSNHFHKQIRSDNVMAETLYGKTDNEQTAAESLECRKIVQTIMQHGITQHQILHICKLLSLELENTNAMQRISSIVNEILDDASIHEQKIIV